ncbi:WD40 repeat domain-containing protein [Desulfovibrio inopinatus]|uniref:WD40 repeat domain-containing protein n=1 Tax=Desulfovibrio inopinatus TaxID=102109 RepID=UPI0004027DBE|nr:WD40 repeat domain-containing protein [Desulfovibrio inopinatus]
MSEYDNDSTPGLTTFSFDAFVTGAAVSKSSPMAGFGLGDGRVALVDPRTPETPNIVSLGEDCGILSFAAAPKSGFIAGTDDGRFLKITDSGEVLELLSIPGKWIEPIAVATRGPLMAAGAGNDVYLFADDADEAPEKLGPHPGTVTGLAVAPGGTIVACAHHGGMSLWKLEDGFSDPKTLEWPGSNQFTAFSPGGRYLVCATQDKTLYGLDFETSKQFGLTGYPNKVTSLGFTADESLLLTDAEQAFVAWVLPRGQSDDAVVFSPIEEALMTAIAPHPKFPLAVGGFTGGVVMLADMNKQTATPMTILDGDKISCLNWSHDGLFLVGGSEDGDGFLLNMMQFLGMA